MELKIKKETAKNLYLENRQYFQEIEKELSTSEKMDWKDFKTFDDLCRATGTTEVDFNRKWEHAGLDPSTIAFERLKILTSAYNQDWPFDCYNTNQRKWYPWFNISSSGFGFSYSFYFFDYTYSGVGSRLCFKHEETSNHAGKTFIKLFEDFITAKF